MTRRAETDPRSVELVRAQAERLGYGLGRIRPGVWALWRPNPDAGDPFTARPVYVGPWHLLKAKLGEAERTWPPVAERARRRREESGP